MLSIISSLVPGVGPRLALWLTAAALIASTSAALFVVGEMHGRAGKAGAVAACDARWTTKYAEAEMKYARKITAATAEAAAVTPAPADTAALDRLCQQSVACRDRRKSGRAR